MPCLLPSFYTAPCDSQHLRFVCTLYASQIPDSFARCNRHAGQLNVLLQDWQQHGPELLIKFKHRHSQTGDQPISAVLLSDAASCHARRRTCGAICLGAASNLHAALSSAC